MASTDFNWDAHWDRKKAAHNKDSIDVTMLVTESVFAIDDLVEKMEDKIDAITEKLTGALGDQWSDVVAALDEVTNACDSMMKADVTLARYNKYHDALYTLREALQTVLSAHRIKYSAGLLGSINNACKKSDALLRKVVSFTDANVTKATQAKSRMFWQKASDEDDWMAEAARQPVPVVLTDSDFEDVPDNFSDIVSEQETVTEDDYDEDLRTAPVRRKRAAPAQRKRAAPRSKKAATAASDSEDDESESTSSDSDSCSDSCSDSDSDSDSDSCSDSDSGSDSDSSSDSEDDQACARPQPPVKRKVMVRVVGRRS